MSERMTHAYVDYAFECLVNRLTGAGSDVSNIELIHGSVSYSRQWYLVDNKLGRTIRLGSNLREAYNSLWAMYHIVDMFNMASVPF